MKAAVHAARNSKPHVTLKDLEWAKDRVMMGAERKSAVITPEDKRLWVHSALLPTDRLTILT